MRLLVFCLVLGAAAAIVDKTHTHLKMNTLGDGVCVDRLEKLTILLGKARKNLCVKEEGRKEFFDLYESVLTANHPNKTTEDPSALLNLMKKGWNHLWTDPIKEQLLVLKKALRSTYIEFQAKHKTPDPMNKDKDKDTKSTLLQIIDRTSTQKNQKNAGAQEANIQDISKKGVFALTECDQIEDEIITLSNELSNSLACSGVAAFSSIKDFSLAAMMLSSGMPLDSKTSKEVKKFANELVDQVSSIPDKEKYQTQKIKKGEEPEPADDEDKDENEKPDAGDESPEGTDKANSSFIELFDLAQIRAQLYCPKEAKGRDVWLKINKDYINGCSVPGGWAPYIDTFTTSCERHDVCYTCGKEGHGGYWWPRGACDDRFYWNMVAACFDKYCSKYLDAFQRGYCFLAAEAYHLAVDKKAADHYMNPSAKLCSESVCPHNFMDDKVDDHKNSYC